LIPLEAYAPDDAALTQVLAAESEPGKPPLTPPGLQARWAEEAARLADAVRTRRWSALAENWRTRCP
jgi:hypothetical protein